MKSSQQIKHHFRQKDADWKYVDTWDFYVWEAFIKVIIFFQETVLGK